MNIFDESGRSLWIQYACQAGTSFWFKGNPPFSSPTSHMFFVLGKVDDDKFVVVNATSQVEKRIQHLDRKIRQFGCTAKDVSVVLCTGAYSFIKKRTILDCSQPFLLSTSDLNGGDEFALLDAPPDFFVPLLKAWAASPFAIPAHLKQVRAQWSAKGITF